MIGIFSVQAEVKEKKESNETNITLDSSTEYKTIRVATEVPQGIKDVITQKLIYPRYAKDVNIEGQVYIRLTIDNNNRLQIVGMNATTPYLGEYVSEQLDSTFVKNPGCEPGQVYMMKINFDLSN